MNRFAAAALAAALTAGAASAETWSVTASLTDGSELHGTIPLDAFQLESSLGMLDIRMEQVVSVSVEDGKAVVKLKDGSSLTGTLKQASWKMGTSVGQVEFASARLKVLTVLGRATAEAPPVRQPGPARPAVELPTELKPVALDLTTVFAGPLEPAPGGSMLLVFDAGNARLLAVDGETMKVQASVDVPAPPFKSGAAANAPSWSLSPAGRNAFVACGKSVTAVDVDAMKVVKTFPVEHELLDIVALSEDALLARTPNSIVLITLSSQGILRTWQVLAALHPSHDRRRVITDRGSFTIPSDAASPRWCLNPASGPSLGRLAFSGDGRWALSTQGAAYRVGLGSLAELAQAATTAPNLCAVFLRDAKTAVLFTREAVLDIRSTETFAQIRTIKTGPIAHLAAAAPADRVVWAVFAASPYPASGRYPDASHLGGPGKLFRFEVPEK